MYGGSSGPSYGTGKIPNALSRVAAWKELRESTSHGAKWVTHASHCRKEKQNFASKLYGAMWGSPHGAGVNCTAELSPSLRCHRRRLSSRGCLRRGRGACPSSCDSALRRGSGDRVLWSAGAAPRRPREGEAVRPPAGVARQVPLLVLCSSP